RHTRSDRDWSSDVCSSDLTTAPSGPPAATVSIREWSAAYYGSAAAGKGTLYYNGRRHHFTISGLGAGGMGGQKISATGKVYNLRSEERREGKSVETDAAHT